MSIRSTSEKFAEKINFNGPIHPIHNQCWMWTGFCNKEGYGKFKVSGKEYRAHRYMWCLMFRDCHNLYVLHKCDNPGCVNPDHLFLGTQSKNMTDRNNKGRQAKGIEIKQAILTEERVREIRLEYRLMVWKLWRRCRILSLKYNTHPDNIRQIVNYKTWKHVS